MTWFSLPLSCVAVIPLLSKTQSPVKSDRLKRLAKWTHHYNQDPEHFHQSQRFLGAPTKDLRMSQDNNSTGQENHPVLKNVPKFPHGGFFTPCTRILESWCHICSLENWPLLWFECVP
ncbi:uncharacterized protein LOC103793320 isoform X1 [Callithrix jacchus]